MRLAQEELRIAIICRRKIATLTKLILHELTGFVYEYLRNKFEPPRDYHFRRRPVTLFTETKDLA